MTRRCLFSQEQEPVDNARRAEKCHGDASGWRLEASVRPPAATLAMFYSMRVGKNDASQKRGNE